MTTDGQVGYYNNAGAYVSMNRTIGLSQFNNPAGLEKAGSNLLRATNASGAMHLMKQPMRTSQEVKSIRVIWKAQMYR